MTFWQSLIYGFVQGLTEFLPVSSSGHLFLLEKLFGYSGNFLLFAILLHIATLFAVVIALRSEVVFLLKNPLSKQMQKLVVATIPTIIFVLLFKNYIDSFFQGDYLALCFVFTGVILGIASILSKPKVEREIKFSTAFLMGIAQGIAVVPGISRSGATLCTGLIAGEGKEKSAKFSFLMSIPIIIASLVYEIIFSDQPLTLATNQIFVSVVAFVVALIMGILAIKFMLRIVNKAKLWWFSIYLFILGAAVLIWSYV